MKRWQSWIWLALGVVCLANPAVARESRTLESFESGWRPVGNAAMQKGNAGKVAFTCKMSRGEDRYSWDKTVQMDLSRETSIELKVACADPAAIRLVALYVESGNGWYLLNAPITHPGKSTLLFSKASASPEGSPAGWDQVKRIRISAWKGEGRDTVLHPLSIKGFRDRVFVIQPTSSTPRSDQRWLGRSAFERMTSWLNDAGVSHGVLTDDEVKKGKLGTSGVAILPYNPVLDWAQHKYLSSFVKGGGRLIVCRGESPELAELMGVKVGRFQSSGDYGKYNAIRFNGGGYPQVVYDHNWEIVTATPVNARTRVLATWIDARNRDLNLPAVMESAAGYWFTQVLRSGDQTAKQRMLLRMIAQSQVSVWHQALTQLLEHPLDVPTAAGGFEGAYAYLQQRADQADNQAVYQTMLQHAGELFEEMKTAWESGRYAESYELGSQLRSQLLKCYAKAQPGRAKEMRGVWDHNGTGLYGGGWEETCQQLAANGMNTIFPNMLWSYKAHYPSRILSGSKTFAQYGDQVAQCTTAAKKHGLEVHLWKICWKVVAGTDQYDKLRAEGRLQQNSSGETIAWLNPSHPANRKFEIDTMVEVVKKYKLDGLHLDYIRYPDRNACYSPVSRAAFERYLGRKVASWPADATPGGKFARQFEQFRAREINSFVAEAYKALKQADRSIEVSAAVWGSYPDCITSRGQDWAQWIKAGTIDFVAPMNYTENPYQFTRWVSEQVRLPGAAGKIVPGIGVVSNEAELRADQTIRQINLGRANRGSGYVLFKLDAPLIYNTLPLLRAGVNR